VTELEIAPARAHAMRPYETDEKYEKCGDNRNVGYERGVHKPLSG
jgi:hypothetical protein